MNEKYSFTEEACLRRGIPLENNPICEVTAKTFDEISDTMVYVLVASDGRRFAADEDEIIQI